MTDLGLKDIEDTTGFDTYHDMVIILMWVVGG